MDKKILAIKDPTNVCVKCLRKVDDKDFIVIKVKPLGYASYFDEASTEIHLCKDCYSKTNSEWWEFRTVIDKEIFDQDPGLCLKYPHSCLVYEYENEIYDFIENLPIEGYELVENRFKKEYLFPDPADVSPQTFIDTTLTLRSKIHGTDNPDTA
jgi:hypothetical protein